MDAASPEQQQENAPVAGSPSDFLKNIVGKRVKVRIGSGVDYHGKCPGGSGHSAYASMIWAAQILGGTLGILLRLRNAETATARDCADDQAS